MTEDGKIVRPGGDVSRRVNWTVAYPNRARGEFTLAGTNMVQVCDGKSAWVQIGAETRDATPMAREFLRAISLYGGGWGIYRDALGGKILPAVRPIGDEEIDGRKTTGVALDTALGPPQAFFRSHYALAGRRTLPIRWPAGRL
jgi:hypothetical protein